MSELLQLPTSSKSSTSPSYPPNTAAMHAKLVKADYHGALITGKLTVLPHLSSHISSVSDAKNPSLIGCSGIIVHETENAFRVVTGKDETKCKPFGVMLNSIYPFSPVLVLPKQNSIFTFGVPLYSTLSPDHSLAAAAPPSLAPDQVTRTVVDSPHFLFTLYGNQFRFRAAERAGKKFKSKMTIEL
jgi:ribonuclease P protein subunit POP4